MTDELTKQLRAWGFAKANRYGVPREESAPRTHQLERARDFAPGTRERAARQLIGRDGTDRRAFMAAKSGVPGMNVVPMWSCDPVRSSNDADPPRDREAATEMPVPDALRWIDRAVSQMSRSSEVRAMVLVEEFTTTGSQAVKARRVQERYGGRFSVWMYRRELQRALDWLGGRIAA